MRGSDRSAPARAKVATPVTRSELEHGVDPQGFTVHGVAKRIAALRDDPWQAWSSCARQSIMRKARRALGLAT